jgi:hypothetical protein
MARLLGVEEDRIVIVAARDTDSGGAAGPLDSQLYRIPTHFSLNLHGV